MLQHSSTYLQLKPWNSDNSTNNQLADILSYILSYILDINQIFSPTSNSRKTKAWISDTFSSTKPNKLNNFLFQCCLYFHANSTQFDIDIAKINFIIMYLPGVIQNWFKVSFNQED